MIGNFGGLALDYFGKKRIMMVYTKGVYTIIFCIRRNTVCNHFPSI